MNYYSHTAGVGITIAIITYDSTFGIVRFVIALFYFTMNSQSFFLLSFLSLSLHLLTRNMQTSCQTLDRRVRDRNGIIYDSISPSAVSLHVIWKERQTLHPNLINTQLYCHATIPLSVIEASVFLIKNTILRVISLLLSDRLECVTFRPPFSWSKYSAFWEF